MGSCPECRYSPCHCWPPESQWWRSYAEIHGFPEPTPEVAQGMAMALQAKMTEAQDG